jgi:hypothetical protein
MRQKGKTILLGLILAVVSLTASGIIFAQRSVNAGMVVHPSNFDISGAPGNTVTDTVTLDNLQSQTIKVKIETRNFFAEGEEGAVNLTTDDTSYSLAKWIKVEPETAEIKAHESKTFTFKVTVPKNAEPGGHFGSIVFTTVPPAVKGTGASLSMEVASLISLEIPGDVKEKAIVESFTVDKSFYEFGPVIFSTRVNNQGGRHIVVNGSIVVKGWFGQNYVIPLNPPENILPSATKRIESVLKNKLLVGPFTAKFIATYGSKGGQLNAGVEFTAFPVRYGIAVLVILFILLLARKRIAAIIKISAKILFTGKLPQ